MSEYTAEGHLSTAIDHIQAAQQDCPAELRDDELLISAATDAGAARAYTAAARTATEASSDASPSRYRQCAEVLTNLPGVVAADVLATDIRTGTPTVEVVVEGESIPPRVCSTLAE